ncbi:RICIN domain-containing protein [Streptomyces sp. 1222.5]|uniref:RICIN domain-containing protein n=1 Tax=Streptomyces sp. 1222.5 TaxID=1881026 RepID=UPI003EB9DA0B
MNPRFPRTFGAVVLAAAMTAAVDSTASANPQATGPSSLTGGSQTFSCNYDFQLFTVPEGVTEIYVVVDGAQGTNSGSGSKAVMGGYGARVTATLPVSPKQQLVVNTGCQESRKQRPYGYGMGGAGGVAHLPAAKNGMAGGGASAITTGDPEDTPLVVAGGGGGAGGAGGGTQWRDAVGGPGGSAGLDPTAGGQGKPPDGGAGGAAAASGTRDGGAGTGSSVGEGGGGGGGGGGGFEEGGAGGHGAGGYGGGGGGGAGASHVDEAATHRITTSNRTGNGKVTIAWPGNQALMNTSLGTCMIAEGAALKLQLCSQSNDQRFSLTDQGQITFTQPDGQQVCVQASGRQVTLQACNLMNPAQRWRWHSDTPTTTVTNSLGALSATNGPDGATVNLSGNNTMWTIRNLESEHA